MCGIFGLIGKNFGNQDYLQKVKFLLNHRGPDTSGIWNNVDLNISFVHTRLSILDLSVNGSQPMFSMSKQFVCCYNGEIYNHQYLRKQIINHNKNILLRGNSDTETVVNYIEIFGIDRFLANASGMFALSILDIKKKKIIFSKR